MTLDKLPEFPNRSLLTGRELEVVNCIVHGMSNKETGRELHISPKTCEDHRMHAYKKLGLVKSNVALLVRYVYQLQ